MLPAQVLPVQAEVAGQGARHLDDTDAEQDLDRLTDLQAVVYGLFVADETICAMAAACSASAGLLTAWPLRSRSPSGAA